MVVTVTNKVGQSVNIVLWTILELTDFERF